MEQVLSDGWRCIKQYQFHENQGITGDKQDDHYKGTQWLVHAHWRRNFTEIVTESILQVKKWP
jgi:hypothetical protein